MSSDSFIVNTKGLGSDATNTGTGQLCAAWAEKGRPEPFGSELKADLLMAEASIKS